jgi:hypothetical protein
MEMTLAMPANCQQFSLWQGVLTHRTLMKEFKPFLSFIT